MSISKAFMDELRSRIPVSEVIGKRTRIQRAGHEYKACCPFHKEKTPSFTINDQKGFYHCFGCGAHGDVINFVMQHDNLSFIEAMEQLAPLAGMEIPKSEPQDRAKFDREKDAYQLLESAAKWFENQLWANEGRAALQYLEGRELTHDTMTKFRLGYAPMDEDALFKHLEKEGFKPALMEELGLVRKSNRGAGYFSFFRGRIIFPVTNRRGRVVAFGGRIMPAYDRQEGSYKPPKYLNSPDHFLFHKGQLLYGLPLAAKAGADGRPVILAEGYMDVIALNQAGFDGAVAPLGTAFTETQVELLWKICPYDHKIPYLCFDGDEAGKRAAYRSIDRIMPLLKPDYSVRFAFLQDGEDPDSLVRKGGKKAFDDVLASAASLFDVVWQRETDSKDIRTPEAQAGLKLSLENIVKTIADKTVQSFYFRAVNDRLYDAFRKKQPFQKGGKGAYKNTSGGGNPLTLKAPQIRPNARQIRERILLAAMLNHPWLFEEYGERFAVAEFTPGDMLTLRNMIVELLQREEMGHEALKSGILKRFDEKTLEEIAGKNTLVHASFAKTDAQTEDVIIGWTNTLELIEKERIIKDLRSTGHAVAKDLTTESLERLKRLGKEAFSE